jgi:hypothetical protein
MYATPFAGATTTEGVQVSQFSDDKPVSLLRRIFLPSLSVAPTLAAGLKKPTPGSPLTASSSTFLKAH